MRPTLLLCAAVLALCVTAPSAPAGDAADPAAAKQLKEWLALCDEWNAAGDDAAKLAVEAKAMKLAPLPASAVKPISDRLFDLAAKTGPKIDPKGGFFVDKKAKLGRYLIGAPPKKH